MNILSIQQILIPVYISNASMLCGIKAMKYQYALCFCFILYSLSYYR